MIKHVWSVLCKESTINIDNNSLSIRDVFENLQVSIKPDNNGDTAASTDIKMSIPIEYEIVSYFVKPDNQDAASAEIQVSLLDPTGSGLITNIQKFEMPKNMGKIRLRMKMVGLVITRSGIYTFKISTRESGKVEFKEVAQIPLEVDLKIE